MHCESYTCTLPAPGEQAGHEARVVAEEEHDRPVEEGPDDLLGSMQVTMMHAGVGTSNASCSMVTMQHAPQHEHGTTT